MYEYEDIYQFISRETGIKEHRLKPDTNIRNDLGIEGDDFFELAEKFVKAFNVDMSTYCWYFHHRDEGFFNIGGLFLKPPYKRVKEIPVTPGILLESAHAGRWVIEYPPHKIPERRIDISITRVFLLIMLAALVILTILKLA